MTEEEWLACEIPNAWIFSHTSSQRKIRLYACACCQRIRSILTESGQDAIETAERFADGNATREELLSVRRRANMPTDYGYSSPAGAAVGVAVALWRDQREAISAGSWSAATTDVPPIEWKAQTKLMHDIFGNPFRPVTFDAAWRTDTALSLARQMYESHDFGAMPILADALQDAGCDHEDILTHCRDANQPHVRGCWVVDLVIGKE